MNLDPVDLFGETLGAPLKRGLLFYAAMVIGGLIGELADSVDWLAWPDLDVSIIGDAFLWPVGVLLTSAGPLFIIALIWFVLASRWVGWIWSGVAACSGAVVLGGWYQSGYFSWLAWAVLSGGLAGLSWTWNQWQHAQWARDLAELNAENAFLNEQRALAAEEEDEDASEAEGDREGIAARMPGTGRSEL